MKNSAIKTEKKVTPATDEVNLENVKVSVKKGKKELITKEVSEAAVKRSIYNVPVGEKGNEKKFRGKIRRDLKRFVASILGKDRNEEERTKSVQEFIAFYKKNWKIQNFKIEDFTNSTDADDRGDYLNLLNFVKSTLEK